MPLRGSQSPPYPTFGRLVLCLMALPGGMEYPPWESKYCLDFGAGALLRFAGLRVLFLWFGSLAVHIFRFSGLGGHILWFGGPGGISPGSAASGGILSSGSAASEGILSSGSAASEVILSSGSAFGGLRGHLLLRVLALKFE